MPGQGSGRGSGRRGTFGPVRRVVGQSRSRVVRRGIEASTTVKVDIDGARDVLADDPGVLVADVVTAADRRDRRFTTTLGVDLAGGGGVRHAVVVELGRPHPGGQQTALTLCWRAQAHQRLFPTFEGELQVEPEGPGETQLTVSGTYAVPLGPIGHFGDGLVGRRIARQSLASFVEQVAERLDREVHRRAASAAWHPAPYPVALREMAYERPDPLAP